MNWTENVRFVTPYVPGEQPRSSGIIKLNTNENPYPPSPSVEKILRGFNPALLSKYPDPSADVLVSAISEYYGVSKESIFVGVGSDDVLAMSFMAFFNSKLPVLFADITYSFYPVWCELFRIPYKTIPVDESFCIHTDDYDIPNGGIVIANPNAPSGLALEAAQIESLVKKNTGSVCIVDEAYIDFGGESVLPLIEKYDNLLVVRTFSKSRSLAGSRIGYAFGSKKLIGYLNDVKFSFNSYTMDSLTQAVGKGAMSDRDYFEKTTKKIISTRERTRGELLRLGFKVSESKTNFLFATHPGLSAEKIFLRLKEAGIYTRYFSLPRIDNYLRISIGTDEEMDRFLIELSNILKGSEG